MMNAQRSFWQLAVSVVLSGAASFPPYFGHVDAFAETEKEIKSKNVEKRGVVQ